MIHITDRDKVLYSLHTIHPFYWKYTYKPQKASCKWMFCSQRTHNRWTNTEEPICYQGKISEISCDKIPTLDCYNLCSLVMFTFGQHDKQLVTRRKTLNSVILQFNSSYGKKIGGIDNKIEPWSRWKLDRLGWAVPLFDIISKFTC